MAGFASGLRAAQESFGMHLVGGDTDRRAGPITISITVLGEVATGTMIRRGRAQLGDHVCVCGPVGDAALGLLLRTGKLDGASLGLAPEAMGSLVERSVRPTPVLGLIPVLRRHARAAMDISDGLAKDLGRMCRASGVGAEVATGRIPVSAGAVIVFSQRPDLLIPSVTAGDDYVVLCAVPPGQVEAFVAEARDAGAAGTAAIGTFTEGAEVRYRRPDGGAWDVGGRGWDHL
jgi:thiamine-monophosphate kinase